MKLVVIKKEEFNVYKNNAIRVYSVDAPMIVLSEDEKDATFVERDGIYYLIIRTEPEKGPVAFLNHTSFVRIEAKEE